MKTLQPPKSECWISIFVRPDGYGCFRHALARHRAVWEEVNGKLPRCMQLHHLCGNRACYRPSHLLPVGATAHAFLHGKMKAFCKQGHPFSGSNLRIDRAGKRRCRRCICNASLKYDRRQHDARMVAN